MKKYVLMLIPFIISAICFVAYATIGTGVNSSTTMVEQFYLIVGTMVFFFIGVVVCIVFLLSKVVKKMNEM